MARTRSAVTAAVLLFAACAAPPKPAPPVARTPKSIPSVREKPEPAPDLTPVADPKELVLVARVAPSERTQSLLGTSLRPADVVHELAPWLADAVRDALAPDAPIEVALGVDSPEALLGGPDVVISLGLTSIDDLRRVAEDGGLELERRDAGVWRLNRRGVDVNPECRALASVGPTPLRLACGEARALEVLGAFVARSLPIRDLGSALAVVEARPAKLAREQGPAFSRALAYLAPMLARESGLRDSRGAELALRTLFDDAVELAGDSEVLRVEVAEEGEGSSVVATAKLGSQKAWLARTLTSYAARGDSARELFAELPDSTELAWFSAGPDPARSDEARNALVAWLAASFGPGVERATLELLARTFLQRAPYVYAEGDALDHDARPDWSGRGLWEKTLSTFGWHLIGVDEPFKTLVPDLDAGMRAYNGGDLRNLVYAELPRLCPGLGKIVKKPVRAKGLPAGTLSYQLDVPGKMLDDCVSRHGVRTKQPAPNVAFAVVAVPRGAHTWIGFGPEPDVMLRRMAELLAPPPGKTLGTSTDLFPATKQGVKLGGFVTLAGVAGLMRFLTMYEGYGHRRRDVEWLPNHGRTRIPFALGFGSGSPPEVRFEVHVPPGALRDLATRSTERRLEMY